MNLAPVAELDGADAWDEADPFDGSQYKGAARPAKSASQKAPPLSPEARRQRRLASNRMAAKRAYYRRIDKMSALQQDNADLANVLKGKDAQIFALQNVVRHPAFTALIRRHLPAHTCLS